MCIAIGKNLVKPTGSKYNVLIYNFITYQTYFPFVFQTDLILQLFPQICVILVYDLLMMEKAVP